MTPAAESRTDVNGVSLFTRRVGDGPVTLVLHGGPGAHHDYLLPQFDRLARGRTLVYYDQRGGGRSPVERGVPLDWRAHVDDLHALIGTLDLDAVHLLAFSWGGLLALLYATTYHDAVDRLALVCPAPAVARDRQRFEAAFAERARHPDIADGRAQLQTSGLRTRDPETYRRRLFELSVAPYFHDLALVRDLTPFRVTGRTQEAVWESLGAYDLRDALPGLDVPTLVLAGRHDPMPLDAAAGTAQMLGAELVVFEASGHCPHVEETDRFVEVLDRWLPSA